MNSLKRILGGAALALLVAGLAFAQDNSPRQFAGAGASWNQFSSPQINGLLVYAHRLTGNEYPTYSFSAINLLSVSRNPFKLLTTTETGVAQYLTKFGPFSVYGLGTAGMAAVGTAEGTSTGYVLGTGALALAGFKGGWKVGPYLRVIKSSLAERQWAVGVMVGWGE
jgi:hypothetical protein